MTTGGGRQRVQTSYDAVARSYANRFLSELDHKPLDRALLAWFAEMVRGAGPVADLGAGPGQITRFLHELGAAVFGVDLSPGMVSLARELHQDRAIEFRVGDFLSLDMASGSLAGVVSFYAYIHVPVIELSSAFSELRRVLRAGAPALLAFHLGDETLHVEEFLDRPVDLDVHFFSMDAVTAALATSGLRTEMRLERSPYLPHEYPSNRGYVLVRRPL